VSGLRSHEVGPSGAQTERRGGAGPARSLLGGKTAPAACLSPLKWAYQGAAYPGQRSPIG